MAQRAAIVTGASSGIGLEIARLLGREGHAVTLAARRPEKLEGAAKQLADEGLDVQAVAGNLGLEEDVQRVVAAHREHYGRLDVLVNNAGVGVGEAVGELTTKKVDLQLATNLRSTILFYRECREMLGAAGAEHRRALGVSLAGTAGRRGGRSIAARSSGTWRRSPAAAGSPGCRSTGRPRRRSSTSAKRWTRSSPRR